MTDVAEKARRTLTPTIVQIVDKIRSVFSTTEDVLARSALRALAVISDTISPGEESAITNTLPLVLEAIRRESLRAPALHALLSFSSKLGPRSIPYLKDIVKECVARAREAALAGGGKGGHCACEADDLTVCLVDSSLISAAAQVLRNLLTSIPTFWGEAEVLQVVELYLDGAEASAGQSAEMSLLVKTVAKRASPTVLLPALCNMWERTLAAQAKVRTRVPISEFGTSY